MFGLCKGIWVSHNEFKNKFSLPHDVLNNKIQKKIKIFKSYNVAYLSRCVNFKIQWTPQNDTFVETDSGP